jgi:hypothetical protein
MPRYLLVYRQHSERTLVPARSTQLAIQRVEEQVLVGYWSYDSRLGLPVATAPRGSETDNGTGSENSPETGKFRPASRLVAHDDPRRTGDHLPTNEHKHAAYHRVNQQQRRSNGKPLVPTKHTPGFCNKQSHGRDQPHDPKLASRDTMQHSCHQ